MFRFLIEGIHLLLLYGFYYLTAILICILGLVYLIQNNQKPFTPDLPSRTWSEPIKIQRYVEICPRIDGCPIVEGVCEDCVEEKTWVMKHL